MRLRAAVKVQEEPNEQAAVRESDFPLYRQRLAVRAKGETTGEEAGILGFTQHSKETEDLLGSCGLQYTHELMAVSKGSGTGCW